MQGSIHAIYIGADSECGETGYGHLQPAGHDTAEMRKIRIDVETNAVKAYPVAHTDADTRDLGLTDENTDLPIVTLTFDTEPRKRRDQPIF